MASPRVPDRDVATFAFWLAMVCAVAVFFHSCRISSLEDRADALEAQAQEEKP